MRLLAKLSLANRSLVVLIAIVVTGFGVYAIPSLKQQLLPSLAFPSASVVATYPGASPQVAEDQVARPIEDAVRGVAGVTDVTSTSREGAATVQVQFAYGTKIDDVVSKLQAAVNRVAPQLPSTVKPQVLAGSTDDLPVVVLAASGGSDLQQLAAKLKTSVVPELAGIEGVRDATVTGVRDRIIVIKPDPAKLAAAGVNAAAITNAVKSTGTPMPAGGLSEGDKALAVQVGGRLSSADDLKGLYLAGGKTPVKLGDVASVTNDEAPATSLTRTNGKPSLGVSITMKSDGNAVTISDAVGAKLTDLGSKVGGELTVVFDQAPYVSRSINDLTTEGLLGLGMAVLVILVFLLSLRSTIVTAVSIPLSIVIALIALWGGGESLNMLTLGALTIAVGRVVDDSIVVLENIKRHLGYGEDKKEAILNGVREVAGAVTASTLTTVAVFAPIAFVGDIVGELFRPFAATVTVALLASLLVSLTIIPVLAYWFLKPPRGTDTEAIRRVAEEKERRSFLNRIYVPIVRLATRRRWGRWATIALALGIMGGTFAMAPLLKTTFIDSAGQTTLSMNQRLPEGTSLAAADAAATKVEGALREFGEITSYQVTIGGGSGVMGQMRGGGSGAASNVRYSLTLKDGTDNPKLTTALRDRLGTIAGIGEIAVGAGGGPGGPGGGNQLKVTVRAADEGALRTATDSVRTAMAGISGVTDVTSSLADTSPRIDVTAKRDVAARYGLTDAALGQLVSQAFRGSTVTQLTTDGAQRDVVLRVGDAPASVAALRELRIPTAAGPVRLDQVADVAEVKGPVQITRINGARSATVTGTATGKDLGATSTELRTKLAELSLPAGATSTIGGASADQAEAFTQLGIAMLAAIAIVFMIMVAAFRSLVQPMVLLVSIPFAATGAIALLLATGTALGLAALIGALMLVGIVVTNAIVLLDLVNQYRARGMSVGEAVVEGGRHRLRPILMTAFATIFAPVPMALGFTGGGGFISKPLAIVVIGGLLSSTLLTLVLVPTLYTMVETTKERFRERRDRRRERRRARATPPPVKPTEDTEDTDGTEGTAETPWAESLLR